MRADTTPVHVPKPVHRLAKIAAAQDGVSLQDWIVAAINSALPRVLSDKTQLKKGNQNASNNDK